MVVESVGLPTPNFRPPISPPLHLTHPLSLNPRSPTYSSPKILTKHFCTIKFNHNYKNVALGLRY